MSELSLTRFRVCTKCRCILPATITFFYREPRSKSGIGAQCRSCRNMGNRRYYKQWWANGGRVLSLKNNRAWVAANPNATAEHKRRYSRSPKGRAAWVRNRARRAAAEGFCSAAELLAMYRDQEGLCAYCETQLGEKYTVDHMIPISRGGANDWSNLAIVCALCNNRKFTKTTEEFFGLRTQK